MVFIVPHMFLVYLLVWTMWRVWEVTCRKWLVLGSFNVAVGLLAASLMTKCLLVISSVLRDVRFLVMSLWSPNFSTSWWWPKWCSMVQLIYWKCFFPLFWLKCFNSEIQSFRNSWTLLVVNQNHFTDDTHVLAYFHTWLVNSERGLVTHYKRMFSFVCPTKKGSCLIFSWVEFIPRSC